MLRKSVQKILRCSLVPRKRLSTSVNIYQRRRQPDKREHGRFALQIKRTRPDGQARIYAHAWTIVLECVAEAAGVSSSIHISKCDVIIAWWPAFWYTIIVGLRSDQRFARIAVLRLRSAHTTVQP